MKTIVMSLAALALAGVAHAGTPVKSEYFYQTETGKHQVRPELSFQSDKTEPKVGNTDETSGQNLTVRYEYGINEMLSAGARVGYSNLENDDGTTKTDNKGLQDLIIFLRGQNSFMEGSSLHYGLDLNASLAKAEQDLDANEQSAMSGGLGLTPYVGYAWIMGSSTIGARLQTKLDLGDRKADIKSGGTTTEATGKGGNASELSAFYEYGFANGLVGASLAYVGTNTSELEIGATTTKTAGLNSWRLDIYPVYKISENAEVVGKLSYARLLSDTLVEGPTATELDGGSNLAVNVGGRFSF